VFTVGIAANIGIGLICEGASDIIYAVQVAVTGNFSWVHYAAQKAISLAVSVVCMGWNSIKTAAKAI
jgi:hypothetical protein